MKMRMLYLAIISALCCLTALPALAAPAQTAQADLNGDGKTEQIKLTITNKDTGQFTLIIGLVGWVTEKAILENFSGFPIGG